jgi:hypothetical protein
VVLKQPSNRLYYYYTCMACTPAENHYKPSFEGCRPCGCFGVQQDGGDALLIALVFIGAIEAGVLS